MLPARFEPTVPASERSQTHALDRAATENGLLYEICCPHCGCEIPNLSNTELESWSCQDILCYREILLVAVTSVRVLTRGQADLERGEQTIQ